jgi:hypothetical protein
MLIDDVIWITGKMRLAGLIFLTEPLLEGIWIAHEY